MNKLLFTVTLVCGALFLTSCTEKPGAEKKASLTFAPNQETGGLSIFNQQRFLTGFLTGDAETDLLSYCLFEDICLLEELPILRHSYSNLTRERIMQRVRTSQPWMLERMRELVNALPDAYIPLFGPLTAIAVTDSIPHPYYRSLNGAIYIPPSFLWKTLEERDSLNIPQDPRISDPESTPFTVKWRYLDANGSDPFFYHNMLYPHNRTLEQTLPPFAIMMAHELAHANDFVPPETENLPDPLSTFYDAFVINTDYARISKELAAIYPISLPLRQAAQEYYYPPHRNISVPRMTAEEIMTNFEHDGASSFYGSYKAEEDMAMLFEEVMMKEFFELDRYIAFTQFVPQTNSTCENFMVHFMVQWGEKNRFAAPTVRDRARFVAEKVLPRHDFSSLFAEVPNSETLNSPSLEVSWCAATGAPETSVMPETDGIGEYTIPDDPNLTKFISPAWDK